MCDDIGRGCSRSVLCSQLYCLAGRSGLAAMPSLSRGPAAMSDVESYLSASSSPCLQSPALFTQGAIIMSWWLFGVEDGVVVKPNTAGVNRSHDLRTLRPRCDRNTRR
jgi:hypothetical protein